MMNLALTALGGIGRSVLSSCVQALRDRIVQRPADWIIQQVPNPFDQEKNKFGIMEKLYSKLLILEAVLEDSENKQSKNTAVKKWLDNLQEVIYQAEDILDLINTEALRVKVERQFQSRKRKMADHEVSSSSTDPSNFSSAFLNEIMPKLEEIVQKLEDFKEQSDILCLVRGFEPKKQAFRLPSTSLVDENGVYGRDADRDKIIEALLSDSMREKVSVISIVGLGGVGKTTLAQLVYNHKRVNDEFEAKAWVCISEEYDALRITKDLLKELDISFDAHDSFNSLQTKLQQGLSMKRYFLVLDDIWNSNYNDWEVLSAPLKGGKEGSKILVTTRDTTVASTIGRRHIHHLELISEADCWSVLEKLALNYRDAAEILELEPIGKEIVKKCKGLPLAVKVVAGFLRLKDTIEEWNEVLRSDEWDQANNQAGILPSLRLSYNHLSSHLKRCFAYCAVFPKDYLFRKDEVILLWMANDLLEDSKGKKRLEDIGDMYFHELTSRSLFHKSGDEKFSMHDLVNDLAKFVSGKDFLRLELNQQHKGSSSTVRHFSYISSKNDVFVKFKPIYESKVLRTFLPLCLDEDDSWSRFRISPKLLVDILPALKSLRVLSLSQYSIDELSDAFSNLRQLRFLNLSYTRIKRLPSWICGLYNLQTLLLTGCRNLTEFPEGMEKLINLRRLDVSGVPLIKMPIDIGRLKNLQFLSTFVVSKCSGSGIEELGKLSNLHGEFTIFWLENVGDARDASKAKMKDRKFIEKLTLNWNGDSDDSQVARDVLENLEPHSKIKHLVINGYCGTRFPNWLENPSFHNITSLRISNCEHCFCLPAIGQLPCLIRLTISGLRNVSVMGEEIYGNTCLKTLRIENMREWREWYIPENGIFSGLEELWIVDCPKLIGEIPRQLPSLRKLEISGCSGLVNANGGLTIFEPKADLLLQFHSLRHLRILGMPTLKDAFFVSVDLNSLLPSLDTLSIWKCEEQLDVTLKQLDACSCRNWELEIERLDLHDSSDSIKNKLWLDSFPNLGGERLVEEVSIPHGNQTLTSLQSLHIWNCENFMSFPVGGLPAPNLTSIFLVYCPKLKSLPERMHALLPSLQTFFIRNCPEIECFPEGGLPSSLEELTIHNCKRLWSSHREWGLHRLPSLREFYLEGIAGGEIFHLEDLLLPSTLRSLSLGYPKHLKTINSETLKHITCLQSLLIFNCDNLQSLAEDGLPASLSELTIEDCPNLQSLPEEGLPASLSSLTIEKCPLLKQRLEWEKGEDWPKVSRIPCIQVDGVFVP